MNKLRRLISLVSVAIGILGLVAVPLASAATTSGSGGNGIKVSPVRTDLTINPGTTATVNVNVQNVTSATATFQVIINDFGVTPGNETGQPDLILNPNQYAPSHSLKRFVAPIPNIELGAGKSATVKVNISIPSDAAGGGYFGAVRFAPAGTNQSKNNVSLSASVGSLIIVKVPGDIKDELALSSFDIRHSLTDDSPKGLFTSNKSLYVVARFKNTGNVQEQPFGKIVLKKGSQVLQTSELNNSDPRGNVLPDSTRRFGTELTKVGNWGKYTVEGNFGYANDGQLLSASTTFYVVPLLFIIIGLALIAIILFAIFGLPRVIRSYNRRVVQKSNRR